MQNDILSSIRGWFGRKSRAEFALFKDPLRRFSIPYPVGWRFDPDILVVGGEYSVVFQSRDNSARFTITVNGALRKGFNFESYVKDEFYGPHSGMHSEVKKESFQGKKAYGKEYFYESDGKRHFGGEVVFVNEHTLYLLTWNALEKDKAVMTKIFEYLVNNLILRVKS